MHQDCAATKALRQEADHAGSTHGQVHESISMHQARRRMARREQSIDLMLKVARGECSDEAQFGLHAPFRGDREDVSVCKQLGLTASDVPTAASRSSTKMCHYTDFGQSHDETACPAELWDWFVTHGACGSRSRSPSLSPRSGCSSRSRSPSLSPSSGSSCAGSEFERSQDSTPSPRSSPLPTYCSLM